MATDERAGRLADLERIARSYGDMRLAVAFTDGLAPPGVDPDSEEAKIAKRITGSWERTDPLAGPDWALGVMNRCRTRNPVIVCGRSGLVGVDIDGPEGRALLEEMFGRLPRTVTVATGKGHHLYYRPPAGGPPKAVFELGRKVKSWSEHYLVAPPALHPSGRTYAFLPGRAPWEQELAELPLEVMEALHAAAEGNGGARSGAREPGSPIRAGERNDVLFRDGCAMRRRGMGEEAIFAALAIENGERCEPPLAEAELREIASSAARYKRGLGGAREPAGSAPWPEPIGPAARIGILGRWLEAVEPVSEADPSLLVVEFLGAFGLLAGRHARAVVSGTPHHANEFIAAVGTTSDGRKGLAFGGVRQIMRLACDKLGGEGFGRRIVTGLGSGEGLIWAIRDPVYRFKKGKDGEPGHQEMVDAGVEDKRALLRAGEFSSILRVAGREGSILSGILRDAFDGDTLRNTVKVNPSTATDPHVAAIVDITPTELRHQLDRVEIANGFGNRFLWVCCRRSKLLPDGPSPNPNDLDRVADSLAVFIDHARTADAYRRPVRRDAAATELWRAEYPRLTSGAGDGLFESITARAEAHVLRLSLIYALLDGKAMVELAHLEAALEVWRYAEQSARWIFGDALGNPDADRILRALRAASEGLTRTELHDLFDRHLGVERLDRALDELLQLGRVRREVIPAGPAGGRPGERWVAL